eukprot:TRINITY_DN2140_c0_g1_i4.p1 TRINITY_DN2140_c0_g1~~TRINITY_DN2140_c0_g1_i4.p1  ORF type:complete len:148 (+),score=23.44 TRINITY_DN2140_c0_g1_i4:143-586(+)
MIRRPPRSTHCISSAASDVYKRQNTYNINIYILKKNYINVFESQVKNKYRYKIKYEEQNLFTQHFIWQMLQLFLQINLYHFYINWKLQDQLDRLRLVTLRKCKCFQQYPQFYFQCTIYLHQQDLYKFFLLNQHLDDKSVLQISLKEI